MTIDHCSDCGRLIPVDEISCQDCFDAEWENFPSEQPRQEAPTRADAHTCHAEGCDVRVPPRLLVCGKHWRMVPYGLKLAVWAEYQPGQERLDGTAFPTEDYLTASGEAIEAVAIKEGRRTDPVRPTS